MNSKSRRNVPGRSKNKNKNDRHYDAPAKISVTIQNGYRAAQAFLNQYKGYTLFMPLRNIVHITAIYILRTVEPLLWDVVHYNPNPEERFDSFEIFLGFLGLNSRRRAFSNPNGNSRGLCTGFVYRKMMEFIIDNKNPFEQRQLQLYPYTERRMLVDQMAEAFSRVNINF